jgi:hypothetical protein
MVVRIAVFHVDNLKVMDISYVESVIYRLLVVDGLGIDNWSNRSDCRSDCWDVSRRWHITGRIVRRITHNLEIVSQK